MAAGIKGRLGERSVSLGVGRDGNRVRAGAAKRLVKVRKLRVFAAKLSIERGTAFRRAGDDAADFKTVQSVIC